ncbi:MAG: hypothetical protein KC620_19330, partial [Myxococcales bacterium]|nr:hypothetical protein [Myxococcales bacterium]
MRSHLAFALTIAALLAGCGELAEPTPAPVAAPIQAKTAPLTAAASVAADDAGDAAFVHQVVPTLIGRRVRNGLEFHAFKLIVEQFGRQALVDLLLSQYEFRDYWSQVLTDMLKVKRRTPAGYFEGEYAQDPDCFEPSALSDADLDAVADWILTKTPDDTTLGISFTTADLIEAAVHADDLRPLYLGYAFPLMAYEMRHNRVPAVRKMDGGQAFLEVFAGRDTGCFECHSSTYSPTDAWSGTDRFEPIELDLEGSLFSATSGGVRVYGGQVGDDQLDLLYDTYDPSVLASTSTGSGGPWGMDEACVTNTRFASDPVYGFTLAAGTSGSGGDGFAGLTTSAQLFDLVAQLKDGAATLALPLATTGITSAGGYDASLTTGCAGCHDGSYAPLHADLIPQRSDGRILAAV